MKITAEDVWERFEFNPLTGQLFYKGKPAGSLRSDGYVRIQIKRKSYYAHRLIWLWVHGKWPENIIDHKDGRRNDNRSWRLRSANHLLNNQNRSDNPGVCYVPKRKRYRAYITRDGIYKHIGFYKTEEEARLARANYEANYIRQQGLP